MKRILNCLLVLVITLTATEAFARPQSHHRVHHRHHVSRVVADANANSADSSSYLVRRIRQDFGRNPIGWAHVWCARYLRSVVSSDPGSAFNLARHWAQYGSPSSAQEGAIGVMRSHVGVVAAVRGDMVLLVSGNHGHVVGEGWYPISRFIAFRTA